MLVDIHKSSQDGEDTLQTALENLINALEVEIL